LKREQNFRRAKKVIPGGVNSPARAYSRVDVEPPFIEKGEGPYLYDTAGNRYIDYVNSWGALIFGHAYPAVVEAVRKAAEKGTSFGAPTERETELAKLVREAFPSIEMIRFVNSGTEATMSALRLARGLTGRDLVVKMSGCYHGHGDSFLVEAGSGPATLGRPNSPGVPKVLSRKTITVPYNDGQAVEEAFDRYAGEIAAVILEPAAANMGVVPPIPGYLQKLRDITEAHDSLLIFDEVITGFRVAFGGCQELYEVEADLTCLGKIVGGGLPVGAFGGRAEVMNHLAPAGPVYQAGTLSGNPLATAAGLVTLQALKEKNIYRKLDRRTEFLTTELENFARELQLTLQIQWLPGLFSLFFTESEVTSFEDAKRSDNQLFKKYFEQALSANIYLPPSPFESNFISLAHDDKILRKTLRILKEILNQL